MTTFAAFRQTFAPDNHTRGKAFERVCKWILEHDPTLAPQMRNVWLWNDWPHRWGPDCGIGLVAQDADGKTWAIQAKCYDEDYYVTNGDLDSFLTESIQEKIDYQLLIATTDRIGPRARGAIVNFDPMWCWPKPISAGGPPGFIEASSKWSPKRIAEYCDGWFPVDGLVEGLDELSGGLEAIRTEAGRVGRVMDEFDLTVITWVLTAYAQAASNAIKRLHELIDLGFTRIVFLIEPATPEIQWPILEKGAELIRQFR